MVDFDEQAANRVGQNERRIFHELLSEPWSSQTNGRLIALVEDIEI